MKNPEQVYLQPYSGADKEIRVVGIEHLALSIDYDDVWHPVVDELAALIVRKLNELSDEEVAAAIKRGTERSQAESEEQ